MTIPAFLSNNQAAIKFGARLPALPMCGLDHTHVDQDIRRRSLVVASQLVLWDLEAAGHVYGQGELKFPPLRRQPIRLQPEPRMSSAGSPSLLCAEFGGGA
ncbi:hypothetical protein CHELA1G11_13021 [Hyphomicrobiales bacterium]|nr:hypothetical protein CHELA1G2_11289 [Hyphomicrobiales bacterium]CAH1668751.1 hypothetical protein CHELA1G11_13021 [Hyphomicrobiales bacterium]